MNQFNQPRCRFVFVALIGLGFINGFHTPLCAEPQKQVFNWTETLALARSLNPSYMASKKDVDSVVSAYKGSWNKLFPTVGLTSGYAESDRDISSNRWSAGASINYEVFSARNIAQIRQASTQLDQTQANFNLNSADLRFALRQAFFVTLLSAQEFVSVSKKIREIREANAQTVSLKYDSGRESKGNKLRVMAELAQAQAEERKSLRVLHVSRKQLNQLIGKRDDYIVNVEGTFDLPILPDIPSHTTLRPDHPQLKLIQANIDSARASLSEARSPLWPTLSASYSRTAIGPSYFPDDKHWAVSGLLSLPIFGGGPTLTYYSIKAAQQKLEKSQSEYQTAFLALLTQIETNWASLADAVDAALVQKQFLEASRQRNDESQIRYSMGFMSFEDWELAVADFVNSERGLIQANRDALVAEAQWQQTLAILLEEQ